MPPRFLTLAACAGTLCTALANMSPAAAAWREKNYAVDSRPGVKMPFVLAVGATDGDAAVKNIAVWLNGGDGGTLPAREGTLSEEKTGFAVRGFLSERIGAVAMLGIPTGSDGISLEMRESPAHAQDVIAVVDIMKQAYPDAKVFMAGISNGARSASYAGAKLGNKLAGVILISSSPEAFQWTDELKVPVLVVHHKRDSCLYYRDIEAKAKWFTFVTVEDNSKPRPGNVRDCGPTSAHGFAGKSAPVFQAVADWINTGKTVTEIR